MYNKESDGERAIRVTLDELNIEYEQEKLVESGRRLRNDTKKFRRADFYLPEYKTYLEYLGGWDKRDEEKRKEERKRYGHKRHIYEENNIKCIYIYPKQLNYLKSTIEKQLKEVNKTSDSDEGVSVVLWGLWIIAGIIMLVMPNIITTIIGAIVIIWGIFQIKKK